MLINTVHANVLCVCVECVCVCAIHIYTCVCVWGGFNIRMYRPDG